jgi:predicted metal-binding membrane protein
MTARAATWIAFFGLVLAAWAALWAMVVAAGLPGSPPVLRAALCAAAGSAPLPALWAMWALMAAAMMLPAFVPALRCFLDLRAAGAGRAGDAAALVAGYLAVWLAASLAGAAAQGALSAAGLVAADGSSRSALLSAALLALAGLYQLSAAKAACLARCRHPLTFFLGRWAPGAWAAARMGAGLGVHCLGCCWALMALAFVGGSMNLLWMGAATLFMALEKLPELGRPLTRPAGAALLAAAAVTAAAAR